MATKRYPNSAKGSRRWARVGRKGRAAILREIDTGERYRPARRVPRWNWAVAKGAPGGT